MTSSGRQSGPPGELAELFCELVRRPSPSRHERPVADFVLSYLSGLGLEPHEDDAGGVIGGTAGNIVCLVPAQEDASGDQDSPRLFLGAHMDTVPLTGPPEPLLVDGIFQNGTRGVLGADDKAAIAALLYATGQFVGSGAPHPAYELLFTVCEETGLTGVKHLRPDMLRSPAGAVLDASGPVGGIIVGAPGQNTISATFLGKAAHAGVEPERGRSAIQAAAEAISAMKLGRLDGDTSANVGLIRGGTARNIVPAECFLEAETRGHNIERLAEATAAVVDALHIGAAKAACDVRIEVVSEYRSYRLGPRQAVVGLARAAVSACGLAPDVRVAGGGADANILNELGLPTVNLSTGVTGMHSEEEAVALVELERLTEVVAAMVRLAPARHGRSRRRRQ